MLQSESAVVESKALVRAVTRSTFQLAIFWLNAEANSNMLAMLVALAVFQLVTSPLKADADWKAPTLRGKGNGDKTKDLLVCSCGIAWRWRWHWTTEGSFVNRFRLCGVRVPPVYVRTCWPLGRCSTSRGFG